MGKETGEDIKEMAKGVSGVQPCPWGLSARVRTSGFPLGGMR